MLGQARAYLGYCNHAGLYLGTGIPGMLSYQDTQVDPTGRINFVEKRATLGLNVGVNHQGVVSANGVANVQLAQREFATIHASQIRHTARLNRARKCPLILFDDARDQAFLVSELSVALQLAHQYLKETKLGFYWPW